MVAKQFGTQKMLDIKDQTPSLQMMFSDATKSEMVEAAGSASSMELVMSYGAINRLISMGRTGTMMSDDIAHYELRRGELVIEMLKRMKGNFNYDP